MEVKEGDYVVESTLLGVKGLRNSGVTTNGKTVNNTGEDGDLIGSLVLGENSLSLDSVLDGENRIGLSGLDRQGKLEELDLLVVDERRVANRTDVDLGGSKQTNNVLCTVAVADSGDRGRSKVGLDVAKNRLNQGLGDLLGVLSEPGTEVKLLELGEVSPGNRVTVEKVGNNNKVSLSSKVIGDAENEKVSNQNSPSNRGETYSLALLKTTPKISVIRKTTFLPFAFSPEM